MGLKKNNPGCNCCAATCPTCTPTLLSFDVELTGITEGNAFNVDPSCVTGASYNSTTNLTGMNGVTNSPITSLSQSSSSILCSFNGVANFINYYVATQAFLGTMGFNVQAYASYSSAGPADTTITFSYGLDIFVNAWTLGPSQCTARTKLASGGAIGTTTRTSGDTCKTYITERTFSLTQESILFCQSCSYHANLYYDGFAAVTATITPIWSS
jgi:hypothetical protein